MLVDGDISHDSTAGAAASVVHTAFPLLDGTRPMTGVLSYGGAQTFNNDLNLVDRGYVNSQIQTSLLNGSWLKSALDATVLDPTGLTPVAGDRYLIDGVGAGAFATHNNEIAEFDGTTWIFSIPNAGDRIGTIAQNTVLYYFDGTAWFSRSFEATTASLGSKKVGFDIQADLLAAGGLALTGNSMHVNVADFMGVGVVNNAGNIDVDFSTLYNDAKAIKASDINSSLNGKGASIVGIEDLAGHFTSTNVEGALNEVYTFAQDAGGYRAAAAVAVAKGDPVYVSGNDQFSVLSDILLPHDVVGLAKNAAAISAQVTASPDSTVIPGILTGAIAGDKYFWDGAAHVNAMPVTLSAYVWQTGRAMNATDLAVKLKFVKRNSPV